MFVFTRRVMQAMLDRLGGWMPPDQVDRLVARLNRRGTNRLADMWESVWLDALGQVVSVTHEPLHGARRPDFAFQLETTDGDVSVVGDIAAVSDAGIQASNPFETLTTAVRERAWKEGLTGGGFHVEASHEEIGPYRDRKVQLAVPSGPLLEQLIARYVRPFVKGVARNPLQPDELVVDENGARFTVRYTGPSEHSGGSHRSYDTALSLRRNPIYYQLKSKASQLREAGPDALRLVIICDADCATMHRPSPLEGYTARQIAEGFLRDTTAVDLVLLVGIEERHMPLSMTRHVIQTNFELVAAPPGHRQARLTDAALAAIRSTLEQAAARIPKPRLTPGNARRRNVDSNEGAKMPLAYKCSDREIRISARSLLELLAGTRTQERFAEEHGWADGQGNMFLAQLASGRLFVAARIEAEPGEDDDWIVFRFGEPDPAVSDFRNGSSATPTTPHDG